MGDPSVPFMHLLRLTTVFAGVAAVLTAAGVGRLAAYASIDNGRGRAMWVGARAHGVASAALIMIAAIPHGHLPDASIGWLALAAMGAAVGLACGAVIGAICGGAAPIKIGDVMAAAIKRPGEALRQLLDPEDLIKLGAAVRQRTSQMFEGMFEPAQPPPTETAAPPSDAQPPETKPADPPPPSRD